MNDQTTLKCANKVGYDKTGYDKTGYDKTGCDKTGRVIKVSMKGIPVVTRGIWAEMAARARQPFMVFRPYPILPDAN
ncbi:hypothetical protein ACFZAI_14950 [Achromobacter sp. NPDC008082]|uniref:hypothetical protein n=1 Tax=Achromobacter sp. NPDC008082 TaxID=3363888 RepID=UPI0036EEC9C2